MDSRRLAVSLQSDGPVPLEVSFTCEAGDVLAIFGPSAAGKTTILRAIAGLVRPSRALVSSDQTEWTNTAAGVFLAPHARSVGYVFQDYALFPHLSALDNVAMAVPASSRAERRRHAADLLTVVELRIDRPASTRPALGW